MHMLKSLANKILDIFASKEWNVHLRKGGLVMRRRVPGGWEYRALTREEMEEALMWQAIK
jgi:hypothetical protein